MITSDQPPRRSFFGHMAGVVAAGSIVYGCADLRAETGPDATLLTALEHWKAAKQKASVLEDIPGPMSEANDVAHQALLREMDGVEELMIKVPGRTLDGIKAKALVLGTYFDNYMADFAPHPEDTYLRLMKSILKDLTPSA